MPTKKKMETVQQLTELLSNHKIIFVTDYRGLTVADITQLRSKLRPLGIEYHVVKNTLVSRAAEAVSKKELSSMLSGPVALAFARGDEVQPAKVLLGYRSSANAPLGIKGGLIDSRVLTAQEIAALATMPPIEALRGRTIYMLLSPVYNLHSVLSANIRGLSNLLEARIKQLGGANVA